MYIFLIIPVLLGDRGLLANAKSSLNQSETSTFEMVEISTEELPQTFASSFEILYSEEIGNTIKTFDVSSDGYIVICFEGGGANIYNENLDFVSCISYSTASNQSSCVFWDGNSIVIMLDRSDMLVYLNEDYEISSVYEVKNTFKNAQNYQRKINQFSVEHNGYSYQLKKSITQTVLIQINQTGDVKTVYSTDNEFLIVLVWILVIGSFIFVISVLVLKKCKAINK